MAHRHRRTRPHRQPLFGLSYTILFTICSFLVIAAAALAHLRASTLQQALPTQMAFDPSAPVTLEAWKEIALPGTAHPPPSFAVGNYFYAQLKRPDKILYAKQQTDGSLAPWTTSSFTHGDSDHGYTAVSLGDTAYHFRNGHIIQYVINATDGSVTAMPEVEQTPLAGFHGVQYVWDTAVYVPFGGSDNYIFHLGGFDGPNGPHAYDLNRLHRIRLPIPSSNAQFDVVDNNVPTQHPEKAAFYQSPGQSYGFIYLSNRIGSEIFRLKIQSDGSVGTWDTVAHQPSGTGNNRGDMFIIGGSLFDIRGSKVYSATITAGDGGLSAWDDSPPDLPADQVDFSWTADHNEGAAYGIINDYVYVVGPSKVFYAHINGNNQTPALTNTPVPNQGPVADVTKNLPDYHDKIHATINQQFGVTIPAGSISPALVTELTALFPADTVLRLVNPGPGIVQDASFQALTNTFYWYVSFPSYSSANAFVTAYAGISTKPLTIGLTAALDSTQTTSLKALAPSIQIQVDGNEFSFWPRDQAIALLGRIQPPLLHAVSFTLASNDGTDDASIWQDVKTLFDTMYDASKAIAAPKISYPANSQLALINITAKGGSNTEAIMRKTAVMTGAITVALQTESNKAPIRAIIAGDYSRMSSEERTLTGYLARFIQDAPALFYPWAEGPNGEPFDVGGGIKPIWGIAGTKNGKVSGIFTNVSQQNVGIKFPTAYDISNADIFSTTRGVGKWGQGNTVVLSVHETIAFLSSTPPPTQGGYTPTPLPPGVPTYTPVPNEPVNTPTITLTPKPTKTPRPTYTPAPVIRTVVATIPVMAIKLGKPTESQSFLNWLTVFFQFILPGTSPASKPTPTPGEPTPTPLPIGAPSPTPVGYNPTATPTPSPTPTPEPFPCPGTSNRTTDYKVLDREMPDPSTSYPTNDPAPRANGNLNLSIRGYQPSSATLDIIDVSGSADSLKPPQLATMFSPERKPEFITTYQVFDWTSAGKGGITTNPEVTILGMKALRVGEPLYPPFSEHHIGDNVPLGTPITHPYQAFVLYADENRITLKYGREDSPANGYVVHVDTICTDTRLLSQYNSYGSNTPTGFNNPANRKFLIALYKEDSFGVSRGTEVIVATRTDGSFSDPRTRKNWWRGY